VGIVCKPTQLGSIVEVKRIEGEILIVKKKQSSTVSNCAKTGLTNGLDGLPTRRYRSLGGKNEKEDVASLGVAFGRLSLRRMCNDSRHRGRYTEPRASLEKGSLRIGRDSEPAVVGLLLFLNLFR